MRPQTSTGARPRLAAQPRLDTQRKSALRSLRQQGIIPATLFAHGEPQKIQVSAREVWEHLRHHSQTGMLDLDLNGRPTPALIRELDRDPVTGTVIHLGFQRIDMGERIHTQVPVTFIGEEHLVKEGLVFERQITEIDVVCQAERLPETIEIDVTNLAAGSLIHASDLSLPEGVQLTKDGDTIVARVTGAFIPADLAAELDAQDAEQARVSEQHAQMAADAEAEEAEEEETAAVG